MGTMAKLKQFLTEDLVEKTQGESMHYKDQSQGWIKKRRK